MQTTAIFALTLILASSIAASSYHSSTKLRRDGVLNLYPFPRVGRASHRTWEVPINDLQDGPMKRQLYAFPRVGRSDLRSELQLEELLFGRRNPYVKRDMYEPHSDADTPGMWFGPRLGRGFKSEDDDISQNDADRSESEQLEVTQEREKRQIKRT
ncbi:unnamed protein product, partial [Brenthis ino]